jgi:hypothetical protein
MLTDQEIQAAYMTADSAELFARAIEQAVITKLAGVSVEPVAWRNPVDSYSLVTTHQKETNEFQYSDEFLAGHTEPLYTAEAIAAARVQENERCVQALEALWHSNDDSTKKCIAAIRALINTNLTTGEMK